MRRIVALGAGIPAAFVACFILIDILTDRPFASITEDAWHGHGLGGSPMDGFGSILASVGWGLAAAFCLVGALNGRRWMWSLVAMNVLLLIDDSFGLHDYWSRPIMAGDRHEVLVLAAQFAVLAGLLYLHRAKLTSLWVLGPTAVVFGIGLIADHPPGFNHLNTLVFWLDDGTKLIAIGLWAAWCLLQAVPSPAEAPTAPAHARGGSGVIASRSA